MEFANLTPEFIHQIGSGEFQNDEKHPIWAKLSPAAGRYYTIAILQILDLTKKGVFFSPPQAKKNGDIF